MTSSGSALLLDDEVDLPGEDPDPSPAADGGEVSTIGPGASKLAVSLTA